MLTRHFYEDAGHGWLAVKRTELIALGILDQITGYSYQRGGTVYLEEDCDAATYINAVGRENLTIVSSRARCHREWSPIRYYKRFSK